MSARGRDTLQTGDRLRVQDGDLIDVVTVLGVDDWLIWTTGGTFRKADLRQHLSERTIIGRVKENV